MLVGTQGVLQASSQEKVERVTEARVTADHVVVGHDGAPLAADAAERLHGVGLYPTSVVLLDKGLGWDAPWAAAALDRGPGLDLRVTSGDLDAVRGRAVAVSAVVAREGHVGVGDTLRVRLADTIAATLRIAAVYERAAGLGDVVFDPAFARRHAPGPDAQRGVHQRRPAGSRRAHPLAVPRDAAREQQRRRVGRLARRRVVGALRRAGADQHRGDGDRRAPRRLRHDPPAGRDLRSRDADARAPARPDAPRRPPRRDGDRGSWR